MNDAAQRSISTGTVDRRTVMRATAWAIPAVALAVGVPGASASGEVGALSLMGSCGVQFVQGPGFVLRADPAYPLPVNTTITIIGTGVANIGTWTTSGGATANILPMGPASCLIVLSSPLAADDSVNFRTSLSINTPFSLNAALSLPTGYTVTAGAKMTAAVVTTLQLCMPS